MSLIYCPPPRGRHDHPDSHHPYCTVGLIRLIIDILGAIPEEHIDFYGDLAAIPQARLDQPYLNPLIWVIRDPRFNTTLGAPDTPWQFRLIPRTRQPPCRSWIEHMPASTEGPVWYGSRSVIHYELPREIVPGEWDLSGEDGTRDRGGSWSTPEQLLGYIWTWAIDGAGSKAKLMRRLRLCEREAVSEYRPPAIWQERARADHRRRFG